MHQQNVSSLFSVYPKLFRGMCRKTIGGAIECGDGWLELLSSLSVLIEEQAKAEGRMDEDWPEVMSVGEKYGILSFSLFDASDEMLRFVEDAQDKSAHICERCGNKGELTGSHWLTTRCNDCK